MDLMEICVRNVMHKWKNKLSFDKITIITFKSTHMYIFDCLSKINQFQEKYI